MRIQKKIAMNSEYSRRKAEELIKDGKVYLNGNQVTQMGVQVTDDDEIVVDNKVIYQADKVYYLLNKPTKVICSTIDEHDRTTVVDLVNSHENIYPVGRLDYETTGLIILTNDGELANKLMHPSTEINKKYRVKVKGDFTKNDAIILANGIDIDGYKTSKCNVHIKSSSSKSDFTELEITIHEGRNRQIRKMIEAVGCTVVNLKRIEYSIFQTQIEDLPAGHYRELTIKEVKQLYNLVGLTTHNA